MKSIDKGTISYIRNVLYPELADHNCRLPTVFPIPTAVINFKQTFTHTQVEGNNILVLDPFSKYPIRYYNPTTDTSVGNWSDKTGIVSPVVKNSAFNQFRVVSAGLVISDIGPNDTRQGRILTSNIQRMDAILNSEVSIAMLENSPLYEAKPLTTKSRKAVWYPSDYSSTSMLQNMPSDLEVNSFGEWVMGMVPVVVTSGTGVGRNFTVEISINYEVVPD